MMTEALNGSRKRVRGNRDEENSELPLSKRIHNLRINNGLGHSQQKHPQDGSIESLDHWIPHEPGPSDMNGDSSQPQNYSTNEVDHERLVLQGHSRLYLGTTASEPGNSPDNWHQRNALPQYSPDLDSSDNPYYYENNKLLYDLYVERMQRCGMI